MKAAQAKDVLTEARDPETPSARLEALAKKTTDRDVLLSLARNPSLPTDSLLHLAIAVPEAVLENPRLTLLGIGGAAEFARWPDETILALLARRGAPFELVSWAAGTRDGYREIAIFIGTDPAKREGVAPVWGPGLRFVAGVLSKSSPLPLEAVAPLGFAFLAAYVHTPDSVLAKLTRKDLERWRDLVAPLVEHPNTPKETLAHCLALEPDLADRVFAHPQTTADMVLANAREAALPLVRRAAVTVALARELWPDAERRALVDAPSALVRSTLGASVMATNHELSALARDADYRVRRAVAGNPKTSAALLETLARDTEPTVVAKALSHPELGASARAACLVHERRLVRRTAAAALAPEQIPTTTLEDPDIRTRLVVGHRRDAPSGLLLQLASDPSPAVRRTVAKNPAATTEVLDVLRRDEDPRVRDGLSKRRTKS